MRVEIRKDLRVHTLVLIALDSRRHLPMVISQKACHATYSFGLAVIIRNTPLLAQNNAIAFHAAYKRVMSGWKISTDDFCFFFRCSL